jgi:hypothetical protein
MRRRKGTTIARLLVLAVVLPLLLGLEIVWCNAQPAQVAPPIQGATSQANRGTTSQASDAASSTLDATGVTQRGKLDIDRLLSDTSKSTTEKFAIVREERRHVIFLISELDARLQSTLIQPVPVASSSLPGQIVDNMNAVNREIEELRLRLKSEQDDSKRAAIAEQLSNLDFKLSWLRQNLEIANRDLKRTEDLQAQRIQREGDSKEERDLRNYLEELDDGIASLFLDSDTSNAFRTRITISFAALVGVVIIGFFAIAYKEKEIRVSIFSNDSGLQFITLFSLIIAVILFGVINILEGKELSALLGGLSGYILGRGTFGQRTSSQQQVDLGQQQTRASGAP